jgi:hypothetical protein
VFTCLLCEGFDHESMAPLIQAESTSFLAWNKIGKGKGKGKSKGGGKGKGKSGKSRPRFSAGTKPGLSLEERKKALQKLKSETKCNDCGEYGHCVGDDSCKTSQKSKSSYYAASASTHTDVPVLQDDAGTLWSIFANQQTEKCKRSEEEHVYMASRASDVRRELEEETPVFIPEYLMLDSDKMTASREQEETCCWMFYGEHKGKTFLEIKKNHPDYAQRMRHKFDGKKVVPKYITEFLLWSDVGEVGGRVPDGRTRAASMPNDTGEACVAGCKKFTKKGSNAYVGMITCVECGTCEKQKKDAKPTHDPDNCPHTMLDSRGSTKTMHMAYCKQCCTHIDARDRAQHKKFEDASSKLMIASTDQQQLAEKILEERTLSKVEAEKCLQVYAGMLGRNFDQNSTVSSTQMRLMLEDSFDATKAHSMIGKHGCMCNDEAMDKQDDSEDAKVLKTRDLPAVNIFKDPGIWIFLDEGCNSNCHGTDWAANAIEKLMKTSIDVKFDWIHRRVRSFTGIGSAKVETIGKRKCPTVFLLENSQKIIPGYPESHEQVGSYPLLLSDESQARMGFVKDMREGVVYVKDYDDYLDVYHAENSGLKVVCVSHFPKGPLTREMFVEKVNGKMIGDDVVRAEACSRQARARKRAAQNVGGIFADPHPVLVAHPAGVRKDADRSEGADLRQRVVEHLKNRSKDKADDQRGREKRVKQEPQRSEDERRTTILR